MTTHQELLPAVHSAAEELARSSGRFEIFAREGTSVLLRRDPLGTWELRENREVGVACRVGDRIGYGFAASSGGGARIGRDVALAALASRTPGPDPLPPRENLGTAPYPTPPLGEERDAIDDFAHQLAEIFDNGKAPTSLSELRLLSGSARTSILTGEGFGAFAQSGGVVVELVLTPNTGPSRLIHFAASNLADFNPRTLAIEVAETASTLACGTTAGHLLSDVLLAPPVAAHVVLALGQHLARLPAQERKASSQQRISHHWELVDQRAGPAGLFPLPFEGEGLPSREIPLLIGGCIGEPCLSWAEAQVNNGSAGGTVRGSYRQPPQGGVANLILRATQAMTEDELVEKLGDGLHLLLPAGRLEVIDGRFILRAAGVVYRANKIVATLPMVELRSSFRRLLGACVGCGTDPVSFSLSAAVTTPSLLLQRCEIV